MKKLYARAALALVSLLIVFGLPKVQAQDTLQFGSGTIVNTGTTYPAPYGNWYWGARHQFLVQACDLNGMGVLADSITGLAFDVASVQGTPLTDFTIKMGHTNVTDLTTWIDSLQTVSYDTSYTEGAGWNWHPFDTNFVYDGVSNIVVEVCFNNSGFTNNAIVNQSATPYQSSLYYRADVGGVCGNTNITGTAAQMPNMRFAVSGAPVGNDLRAWTFMDPMDGCGLDSNTTVTLSIVNNGSFAQSGFDVAYTYGTDTIVETVTGSIAPGDTLNYTFMQGAHLDGVYGTIDFVGWTLLGSDAITCNDTSATYSILNTQPVLTFPYIEDFDTTAIQLIQSTDDDFDWTLDAGGTPSGDTGPSVDHTFGTGAGNYYFIETSPTATGEFAILESPCIDLGGLAEPYIHFWYHMYGVAMGSLELQITNDNGQTWTTVWSESGNQGDQWLQGKVDLTVEGFFGDVISYRFIGTDGTSFTSDVALDDVMVFDKPPIHDLLVEEILSPIAGPRCPTSDLDTMSVIIGNCGTFNESGYSVAYSINGGTPVVEPVLSTIQPTKTFEFNFATLLDFSDTGTYDIAVWTVLGTDTVTYNDTMTVQVVVIPLPVVDLGADTAICDGEVANFDAGVFSSWAWSDGSFGQAISPTTAGAYSVTVTNAGGCTDADTVNLIIYNLPTVSLGVDTSICASDSLTLDPGTWSTYLWPDGSTNQTITIDENTQFPCSWTLNMYDSFGDGWNGAFTEVYADTNYLGSFTVSGGTFATANFTANAGDTIRVLHTSGGFPTEESFEIIDANGVQIFAAGPSPANGLVFDTLFYCSSGNSVDVSVTIADANGCMDSDTVNVLIVDSMVLDLGPDLDLCIGDQVMFDAGLIGATYAWSTGDSTQMITVDTAGTYILDMSKCGSISDTVVITQLPLPTVMLPDDTTLCISDSLVLVADTGTITHMWYNGTSDSAIVIKGECEYVLDMFDSFGDGWNGHSMDFYADGQLVDNYTFTTGNYAQALIPVTQGQSISIDFNSGGFPGEVTYDLYNGAGDLILSDGPNPSYGTVYTGTASCFAGGTAQSVVWIEVTDTITGCSNADTMLVNWIIPNPDLGPDTNLCVGQMLTLDPAGDWASQMWQNGATTPSIDVFGSGNFYVDVVDTNGCTGNDSITVIFHALPTPNIGADLDVCEGTTETLDAGAGYNLYVWSTGDSTQTINVDTTGTFSVYVESIYGCPGNDTINTTWRPTPMVDLGADTAICNSDSLVVDAGAHDMFAWNTGDTTQTLTIDSTGTYAVLATDVYGCTNTDDIYVFVIDSLPIDLGPDTGFCDGEVYVLDGGVPGASYTWAPGGETTQSINVTTFGQYSVTVSACGNTATDTVNLIVYPKPIIDAGMDIVSCPFDTVSTVAIGAFTYEWYLGDSLLIGTDDTLTGAPDMDALIVVYGTDTNGCVGNDSLMVDVYDTYQPNLGVDTIICAGTSLMLDAGTDPSVVAYMWDDSTMMQTRSVTTAGTYWVCTTDTNGCETCDSIFVATIAPPSIDLGPDTSVCDNETITLMSGGGMAAYMWSDSSTAANLTTNMGGTYWVSVTSFFGCTDVDTVVVTGLTAPTVDLGADTIVCPGDSIVLDAGAGLAGYLWQDSTMMQTLVADTTNTYSVVVTAANGCQAMDDVFIEQINSAPVVNIGPDQDVCVGDSAQFMAGFPGATYLWNNGSTDDNVWVSTAGMVIVDVTACGFTGSDTAMLVINALPTVDLGADTFYCEGNGMPFSLPLTLGNGFLYNWSTGATGNSITVDTAGTYSVVVTDLNGCSNADTMMVQEFTHPTVDLGTDVVLCPGDTANFDAGAGATYSYMWNDGSTGQTYSTAATETVYVTISSGLCGTASDTVQVTADPGADVDLGDDVVLCDATDYVIPTGGGFASYIWNDGSTADTLLVDSTGSYEVMVTNGAGCTDTDEITVTFAPSPVVDLGADQEACEGTTVTLDAGAGFSTYDWSTGGSNQTEDVSVSGTVSVEVTNGFGCAASDTVEVTINPAPVVDLGPDVEVTEKENYTLDAGAGFASYLWSTAETTQTIEIFPTSDEEYCVTVTDANGCEASDCVQVDTLWNSINVYGAQLMTVSYYPNPSLGEVTLTINAQKAEVYNMSVMSADGKLVASEQLNVGTGTFVREFNFTNLAQGVYYVKLESDNGTRMDKLVIK